MIASTVNRTLLLCTLLAACTPTNGTSRGSESTSAATAASAATTASPNRSDPAIAAADVGRIAGSASAPVWLIIVSDFQCPFCKQWHDESYQAVLRNYVATGKVRMAYINNPLNVHQNAWSAAHAAMCASAQGKFWEMHEGLFSTQEKWATMTPPLPLFDSLARTIGVDLPKWRQCVSSEQLKPLIQADRDRALAAGARSTPTFLLAGELLTGAIPLADLRRALDSAIVRSGKKTP